jgi:hypothetical protein
MTPRNLRRILLGALRDALAAQHHHVRATAERDGRTSRAAKKAVLRLDELREAYAKLDVLQMEERTARMFLRDIVTMSAEDRWHDVECEIESARRYLEEDP